MAVSKKVRIYDLAREVKQDTKRIIEELRREGADVSVPSNSVSKELAEKVRGKYFPKVEKSPKRAIKVIKKQKVKKVKEPSEDEILSEEVIEEKVDTPKEPESELTTAKEAAKTETKKVVKLKKKVVEPVEDKVEDKEVEKVEKVEIQTKESEEEKSPKEAEEITKSDKTTTRRLTLKKPKEEDISVEETEQSKEKPEAETNGTSALKSGRQVRKLKLTKEALDSGVKPGERIITAKPSAEDLQTDRTKAKKRERKGKRPRPLKGTPGETATPKTVYTPPASSNRFKGRGGGRKGGRNFGDKDNRFQEREIDAPRKRSIEERIFDQVGTVEEDALKEIRLTEGATIREFAEGIGVTPRDIVQLLV
ncbi:MAG: translation initiation factor IF-2 N-terminal domain-containing protein, partial [Aridibacter sp.]